MSTKNVDYQAVDHDAGKEAKLGWGAQPCHRRLSRGGEITIISKRFRTITASHKKNYYEDCHFIAHPRLELRAERMSASRGKNTIPRNLSIYKCLV